MDEEDLYLAPMIMEPRHHYYSQTFARRRQQCGHKEITQHEYILLGSDRVSANDACSHLINLRRLTPYIDQLPHPAVSLPKSSLPSLSAAAEYPNKGHT